MKFDRQIEYKIELLNKILTDLKKPTLFENPDFSIGELSTEFYLELKLSSSDKNTISMEIRISLFDLQIGLDRIKEVYEWSNDSIEREQTQIINLIKQLFTSSVLVEYCGSNYTSFTIFNAGGGISFKTPIIQGFYLKFNCKQKILSPIYLCN
jgi:hypothetical protein